MAYLFGVALVLVMGLAMGSAEELANPLFPSDIDGLRVKFEGEFNVLAMTYRLDKGQMNYQPTPDGARYHDQVLLNQAPFHRYAFVHLNQKRMEWYVVLPSSECVRVDFDLSEARCNWKKEGDGFQSSCHFFSDLVSDLGASSLVSNNQLHLENNHLKSIQFTLTDDSRVSRFIEGVLRITDQAAPEFNDNEFTIPQNCPQQAPQDRNQVIQHIISAVLQL
eukprot:TRINITY_DN25184_c0_g1_i1.p1 TRINITY_DN25184_c0_g1~~TRINITY_DN25184_c0_g1_i1.p1  ORF type:complete len:221 (-),score=25.90 TRINITY_DN25184_c0_g1_i1:53-715(-)